MKKSESGYTSFMFVDEVKIKAKAGHGGAGAVSFSAIKMSLGPVGGSGGKGGDVYLKAVTDIGALRHFRSKKEFSAEDGRDGRGAFRDGHDGQDLILLVPRGTVARITGKDDGEYELEATGDRALVAKGGKGGKGNFLYRSSTNTSPKESQPGLPGETCEVELELKLIADVGLIGFPNVGKSSFLNAVTNAGSRVANYEFTTLEPNLGVYYGLVLADLPGLIEGASSGKGLGIKFLRHIERTKILFHFVDANSENPVRVYKAIRHELEDYNKLLLEKEEYIFISKADTVAESRIEEIREDLLPYNKNILPLSVNDAKLLENAKKVLNRIKEELGV